MSVQLRPYVGDLRTIDVDIGGETLPFLFDTAGGVTVLTPQAAARAGCSPFGRVSAIRGTGERIDLERCGPVGLTVGGMTFEAEGTVLDIMALLPPEFSTIGGLTSLHTFAGRAITLDLAGDLLIVESPTSLARRVETMSPLPVRAAHQAGGASLDLFLEVDAEVGTLWLEVDSGNIGPVLLSTPALAQLGLDSESPDPQRVTLEVPGLGPFSLDAVARDLIYDGLLNTAFLNNLVLTVDLASGRAWASRRHDQEKD